MNAVLLSIGIYLLIGLFAALVMARIDARATPPLPWRWHTGTLAYAVVVIVFWSWLLLEQAAEKMTRHLDG